MLAYQFDWSVILRNAPKLLDALLLGLGLAIVSLLAGSLLGLFLAYGRLSGRRWLDWTIWAYVEVIRNTPLLLLVVFVYFGVPEIFALLDLYRFDITPPDKIPSFALTLSLYAAAYMCEVFRSGLASIPRAYLEAARAIGLRPLQRQLYVVLPVMLRITLPAISNNLISLFKDTSLATAIAVPELTFTARQINANTFRVMEAWLTASALYLSVSYALALLLRVVERRYTVIR